MKDGVDILFDLVLYFLKRSSKYKDGIPERILEIWYAKTGRIGCYKRIGILYKLMRFGVDDHAVAECIRVCEDQGDESMQWLLDTKIAYDSKKGTLDEGEGEESPSKS
ncbi:hypothetical protein EAE96_003160 [Botrytis aclada]|nr:hypothetical protein EAE96_003160 [Botrytis aclada]